MRDLKRGTGRCYHLFGHMELSSVLMWTLIEKPFLIVTFLNSSESNWLDWYNQWAQLGRDHVRYFLDEVCIVHNLKKN